jgi:kynurenine formamidase
MGRAEFGQYQAGWTPPNYEVDADGKIVGGYTPPGVSNWGRWGGDDQRGTANLITQDTVCKAASLVRTGQVFSLALPLDNTVPRAPSRPPMTHYYRSTGADIVVGTPMNARVPHLAYTDDGVDMALQGSTHWDALCHVPEQDSFYNGYWAGSFTAAGGPDKLGMGVLRESLVGRGVLVDVARAQGVSHLEPGTPIRARDIAAACEAQGTTIESGNILLLRTGWLAHWQSLTSDELRAEWFKGAPGASVELADWLYESDVAAVASDTLAFEVLPTDGPPDGTPVPLHVRLLVDLGLPIGELWDLERLGDACQADGRYAFLLVAPPLNIPGGTGSPLNPIAIK